MTTGMVRGPNAVKPRSSSDTEGEVQRVLGKLESGGNDIKIMRLMANSPNAFRPFLLMSLSLMERASLPPSDREVAILQLAELLKVEYEWREHVPLSIRAGITDEQRTAIQADNVEDEDLFTAPMRLAMRIARVCQQGRELPTDLWDEACTTWGKEGALDLILTIGWWGGFVPMVINSLGITDPHGPDD
jgi:hypothetical protein